MILNKAIIVYMNSPAEEHNRTMLAVRGTLKKKKIGFREINRSNLHQGDLDNPDLVISIGGDGTFLKAARFIKNQTLILGVNSDTNCKEGFFLSSDRLDFSSKIDRIMEGNFKVKKLTRLEAKIDNKAIKELALNEFYIGTEKPYQTFKCEIKIKHNKEIQKNSGIVIGTASGSHSWLKSCGGKALPIESESYQYVVREPYSGRLIGKYKLLKGVLGRNDEISVTSRTCGAILIADSLEEAHKLDNGSVVRISVSKKKLNAAYF